MERYLPFAQRMASRSEVFQLRFARAAARHLQRSASLDWLCDGHGLELLADNEDVLAEAGAQLWRVYGDDLKVGEVRARYRWDPMPLEPVMNVVVTVPSAFGTRAQALLRARGVSVGVYDSGRREWRFVGDAPAARIIGLRDQLDLLTDGTAKTQTTLLGYFAPPPGPGGDAA
ncbi:hypothetical protein HUS23_05945 [Ectothiorhodospiraceae bacterium 2226]|nr:hypothetical protein HUS23_05945 [Ectothiorhodospiraceae bacterium 2226]